MTPTRQIHSETGSIGRIGKRRLDIGKQQANVITAELDAKKQEALL